MTERRSVHAAPAAMKPPAPPMRITGITPKDLVQIAHETRFGVPLPDSPSEEDLRFAARAVQLTLPSVADAGSEGTHLMLRWMLSWSLAGTPNIILGPKRQADFAATATHPAQAFEAPFPAFLISLPVPLLAMLDSGGTEVPVTAIMAYEFELFPEDPQCESGRACPGDKRWTYLLAGGESLVTAFRTGVLLSDTPQEFWKMLGDVELDAFDDRNLDLAANIVAGVSWAFTQPRVREETKRRVRSKSRRDSLRPFTRAPGLQNFAFTEDVYMDATGPVRDHSRSGGVSPRVRSFVRPHYKNVRYGRGREFTRWQRIEGYVRGPQGAPMSAKTYRWRS